MKLSDFDFELPPERIARHPASPRDGARLLEVRGDTLEDRVVRDLPSRLRRGDLLVVNDTRVIKARLSGRRGAARVEVTLHKRVDAGRWLAFARPAKRLAPGDDVVVADDLVARVAGKGEGGEVVLDFGCADGQLMAALERHGRMPLPPYIRREGDAPTDASDYQTLFASRQGAVAAPTAGLHFTPDLVARLDAAGVARACVTLHVGAGTFLPVKAEDVAAHRMHAEWAELPAETAARIAATRATGGRVVAIGTTSLRTLEAVAAAHGAPVAWSGETDLFILPGFRFRVVDLLLTNFHLPRSTLFMLVAAFAGLARMRAAYAHAIARGYRFFSYGDACLLHHAEGRRA